MMKATNWDTVFNGLTGDNIRSFVNAEIGVRSLVNTSSNLETRAELFRLERSRKASEIRGLFRRALQRRKVSV